MKGYKELRKYLGKHLPASVKRAIFVILHPYSHISEYIMIKTQPSKHKKALQRVREQSKTRRIRVAFFALHSAVWKYENVYRLLEKDDRFDPIVVVCPVVNYGHENMLEEMTKAYKFFLEREYNVVRAFDPGTGEYLDVKTQISPDIIFYTNPYQGLIDDRYYITRFRDVLTCYVNYFYGMSGFDDKQVYQRSTLPNLVWRFFLETTMHYQNFKALSRNKARNGIVTGYPGVDQLVFQGYKKDGIWKIPDKKIKKIIWAPHHTINEEFELRNSNFLKYSNEMLNIAQKYRSHVQISFKPHPLLKIKLYNHKEWGVKRTDEYYRKWELGENTQLNTDRYIDLFNTSDALIHDCGSFTVEYLHCGKPALFLMNDFTYDSLNDFGKLALEHHYQAHCTQDIEDFIVNVVIHDQDNLSVMRKEFYDKMLRPNNIPASQIIYQTIREELIE